MVAAQSQTEHATMSLHKDLPVYGLDAEIKAKVRARSAAMQIATASRPAADTPRCPLLRPPHFRAAL